MVSRKTLRMRGVLQPMVVKDGVRRTSVGT